MAADARRQRGGCKGTPAGSLKGSLQALFFSGFFTGSYKASYKGSFELSPVFVVEGLGFAQTDRYLL